MTSSFTFLSATSGSDHAGEPVMVWGYNGEHDGLVAGHAAVTDVLSLKLPTAHRNCRPPTVTDDSHCITGP